VTNKGAGFNQYTCFDECRKAGSAKCNNFMIKDDGNCQLFSGTCKLVKAEDSKVFEVYHKESNYKLEGSNKQCANPVLTSGTWTIENNCQCGTSSDMYIRNAARITAADFKSLWGSVVPSTAFKHEKGRAIVSRNNKIVSNISRDECKK
jgi:hypothetical protein